jgi:hypothetical protein
MVIVWVVCKCSLGWVTAGALRLHAALGCLTELHLCANGIDRIDPAGAERKGLDCRRVLGGVGRGGDLSRYNVGERGEKRGDLRRVLR